MIPTIVTGGATVGFVLDQFFNRADQLIDKAKKASADVIEIGGSGLRRTIQYAQIVYSKELHKTILNVNTLVATALRDIETIVIQAETNLAMQGQKLAKQAQAIANTLPFCDAHHPQLIETSPCTVFRVGTNPKDIFFSFMGNFVDASKSTHQASLEFNGQTIQISSNTTTDLLFKVPFSTVFPNNAIDKIVYCDGTLTVPWIDKGIIFNTTNTATFKVLIGAFPPSPGTITFDYYLEQHHDRTQAQFKKINSQRGQAVTIYGDEYTGDNKTEENREFLGRGSSGWSIIPGSSYIKKDRYAGDYSEPRLISEDTVNNYFKYQGTTTHQSFGSSGIMEFFICFKEEQYTTVHMHESIHLTWGESYIIGDEKVQHPTLQGLNNHWKITLTPFDENKSIEYSSSFLHRYLKCEKTSGGYRLAATLPDTTEG